MPGERDVVVDDDVDEKDIDYDSKEHVERFAHLAKIKFNTIKSSVISYHGEEYETSKFFSKK